MLSHWKPVIPFLKRPNFYWLFRGNFTEFTVARWSQDNKRNFTDSKRRLTRDLNSELGYFYVRLAYVKLGHETSLFTLGIKEHKR